MRDRWPTQRIFTYWDYRASMFRQDLRIQGELRRLVLADTVPYTPDDLPGYRERCSTP